MLEAGGAPKSEGVVPDVAAPAPKRLPVVVPAVPKSPPLVAGLSVGAVVVAADAVVSVGFGAPNANVPKLVVGCVVPEGAFDVVAELPKRPRAGVVPVVVAPGAGVPGLSAGLFQLNVVDAAVPEAGVGVPGVPNPVNGAGDAVPGVVGAFDPKIPPPPSRTPPVDVSVGFVGVVSPAPKRLPPAGGFAGLFAPKSPPPPSVVLVPVVLGAPDVPEPVAPEPNPPKPVVPVPVVVDVVPNNDGVELVVPKAPVGAEPNKPPLAGCVVVPAPAVPVVLDAPNSPPPVAGAPNGFWAGVEP